MTKHAQKNKLLVGVNKKKRRRGVHTKKRTVWQKYTEYLWPSMGVNAFLRWLEIRIKRTPEGRDKVAMGAAVGMFATFIPLVGLQVLLMLGLCKLLRGNFWVSVLISFLGNPWTFPFIWLVSYQLGMAILFREGSIIPDDISLWHVVDNMGFYFDAFIWPTLVGGLPLGLLMAIITYYVVRFNVRSYQRARTAFLARRRAEEKEKRLKLHQMATEKMKDAAGKLKDTAEAILKTDSNDKPEKKAKP